MAKKMSDEHKQALAKGRAQGKAVREYLKALESERSRNRLPDKASLEAQIENVQELIDAEENPAKRVELIQRRLDHEERLVQIDEEPDMDALEDAFVDACLEYSERKGISYHAWREAGVPAATLKRTGLKRTRRPAGENGGASGA